ncbi:MAG: family 43 glycosylhydrolase [Clostridiales bacterium]|jgi:beta-xylosidase|nr:family 43 glycosylhydrolase [Clostridiales bacterium]
MKKNYTGYLFVHFTGEHDIGEQVYFSISRDGLHWNDLNSGRPVLTSSIGEKGARDPFIIRSPQGDKYYIIATDLRIASQKGWGVAQYEGSRSILVWESTDLVNWSEPRLVEVGIPEAGCVWAPEAIYDRNNNDYFVFWASMVKEADDEEAKQRIYYSRTKDFKTFTKAEKYIERENHVIDTDIVEDGGYYYRISKDETTKNIRIDKCKDLVNGPFIPVEAPELESIYGLEGPAAFKFNNEDKWCLMVDQYATRGGYMPLISEDLSSGNFRTLDSSEYHMGYTMKRHGSILNITEEEYQALTDKYNSKNPILKGLYADPDVLQVGDTYYIYPTSDGFTNWSGTKFHVFSSKDKINWKNEGEILDVATDDVPWATSCAWAPAIATKNGKYYYYFCAKRPDGQSCIGVAVADSPTGPFKAMDEPLLTPEIVSQANLKVHQVIDPIIYIEDDGSAYMLFGNGHPLIVTLNEDMVSIQAETMREIEGAYDFREAIMVVKRDGIYHFTWSCDDTRSENYHINYGISNSLFGPIEYKYAVLEKDPSIDVLGTGHHTILKENGKDEYYMIYHRFSTPLGRYPGEEGYHREVCMDPIEFDESGLMKKVKVTR